MTWALAKWKVFATAIFGREDPPSESLPDDPEKQIGYVPVVPQYLSIQPRKYLDPRPAFGQMRRRIRPVRGAAHRQQRQNVTRPQAVPDGGRVVAAVAEDTRRPAPGSTTFATERRNG